MRIRKSKRDRVTLIGSYSSPAPAVSPVTNRTDTLRVSCAAARPQATLRYSH